MNISRFAASQSGAVTVDWVVLTAAIVGLGLATTAVVSGGVEDLSRDIDGQLRTDHVSASFGAALAEGWGGLPLVNQLGHDMDYFTSWVASYPDTAEGATAAYMAAYNGYHGTNGFEWDRGEAIDAMGAAQAALTAHGGSLPDGVTGYEEMHAAYTAAPPA